ncbi:MAG: hypothetical protein V3R64_02810 [Sphingomonadales bacterium]
MVRAKAGFALVLMIVGAIIFAAFMDGQVSAKFFDEPETGAEQIDGSQ